MTETGPIVIGNVSNISGLAASSVAPSIEALRAWASHTNDDGGICGREVELVVVDDQGDPAQHQAAVRRLVETENVVAFVGNSAPLTGSASVDYLTEADVPVVGNSCTTGVDGYEYNYPHFAHCSTGDAALLGAAFSSVEEAGADRIAVMYCAEAEQCSDLNESLTRQAPTAGAEVVYSASVGLLQPDFTTECRQAEDSGAEALLVGMDVSGTQRVLASCARQGYRPTLLAVTATIVRSIAEDPNVSGVLWSGQWFGFADSNTPARSEFQAVMASSLEEAPSPAHAGAWTAGKVFEEVVARVASAGQPLTSATIVEALYTFEDETLGGLAASLTFAEGTPQGSNCWFSAIAEDGQWSPLGGGEVRCA